MCGCHHDIDREQSVPAQPRHPLPAPRAAGVRSLVLRLLDELAPGAASTIPDAVADAAPSRQMHAFLLRLIEDVMDNLARSLQSLDDAALPSAALPWVKRQRRYYATLEDALARLHVMPLDLDSAPPGTVTIIATVERDDVPEGTVVDVVQRGYLWQGEILRKASVIVAAPRIGDTPAETERGAPA